jgi:hypothetical protein
VIHAVSDNALDPTREASGSEVDARLITIEIETPQGLFIRTIRPATLLPEGVDRGPAAEAATKGAAAFFGLPDFVVHPARERRGPGVREIGDALVITGQKGAAVQVKARERPTNDPNRERAWLIRKANEGASQAMGTIRRLRSPQETRLENVRGDVISFRGRGISWVPVVVIEHPGTTGDLVLGGDAVVMLRRDWEFLFGQLQSTVAVVEYLLRVAPMAPIALGTESLRYYRLAQADARVGPRLIDEGFADLVMRNESAPILPLQPARRSNLIRWVLEDLADVPSSQLDEGAARNRLTLLAAIDSAPISTREEMADTILSWLDQVRAAPPNAVWSRFRNYLYWGRIHLILGAVNQNKEEVREAFTYLVRLRHVERGERSPECAEMVTVGVLLQPRDEGRPWDTTAVMAEGAITLDPEERRIATRLWGSVEEAAQRAKNADPTSPFRHLTTGDDLGRGSSAKDTPHGPR